MLGFGDAPLGEQQIDVPKDLRQRQVRLRDRDVPPERRVRDRREYGGSLRHGIVHSERYQRLEAEVGRSLLSQ